MEVSARTRRSPRVANHPHATAGVACLSLLRGSETWNALVCLAASGAIQLVPSIAMGILFPWLVNAARFATTQIGAGVGRVYACNTVGAIAGAFAASLFLLPMLGTAKATAFCLLLYLMTWIALLMHG